MLDRRPDGLADSNPTKSYTVAFLHNGELTGAQFDGLVQMWLASFPPGWPDGETITFASGLKITVRVIENTVEIPA